MSTKISVLIPTFNVENYIAKAIHSVLQQTEKEIELIIIDDASEDGTLERIKYFNDHRLKLFVNTSNCGAGASRNYAIQVSQGEWIALLDADDWYAPDRLEMLLSVSNLRPDADLIADDLYYIQEQATHPWSTMLLESDAHVDDIKKISLNYFFEKDIPIYGALNLGLAKPLIKKEFLLNKNLFYHEEVRLGQDFWFYVDCLLHGAHFYFVPKPYYFYRSRQQSLVNQSKVERFDQFTQIAKTYLNKELPACEIELKESIEKRLVFLETRIKPYYRVVDHLKKYEWASALKAMMFNPYFFVHFFDQLPKILWRRIRLFFALHSAFR
jgi:succinoglycan biosynthesis protein ExoO